MRRLLIVTTVPVTLSAFLLPFARHFRERGWRVDAMTRNEPISPEIAAAFDHVWTVGWSRNPLDPHNLIATPRIVRDIVEREDYDIVHVHTAIAAFVTRYATRNLRRRGRPKVIFTAHGFHFHHGASPLYNALFTSMEQVAGPWMDYLVVINHEDEETVVRRRIVTPDRLCYMPGIGLDTQYYRPERVSDADVARVRQELGITPTTPLFLMIAEFTPNKRHQDALHALARLGQPEVHMAFAGEEGALTDRMQQMAEHLGLKNQTHFLGFRRDIPALVRAAQATLLISTREGLPRSVMESLSLGTPVIGTDIRGIRDLLADGRGLLVPLGDAAGLARAMRWVIEHPDAAAAMAQRGRAQIANYDVRHIIALHDELYARALEEQRALVIRPETLPS